MPQFIITYHDGSQPESPEEGQKQMAEWMAWVEELGDALPDKGNPVGITTVMTKDGVSDARPKNPLMGYSILEAEDMDGAVSLMSGNPHLKYGGTIEISQVMELPEM